VSKRTSNTHPWLMLGAAVTILLGWMVIALDGEPRLQEAVDGAARETFRSQDQDRAELAPEALPDTPRQAVQRSLLVQDSSGRPLADVSVAVNTMVLGKSDALGEVPPEALPQGSEGTAVIVEARHPDYLTYRNYRTLPLAGQVIRLTQAPGLTVHVVDESGVAIRDAHCQVGTPNADALIVEGWTNAAGDVELLGIEPRECALLVTARGLVTHWEHFLWDSRLKRLEVELHRGRELEVLVSDQQRRPLEGVRVTGRLVRVSSYEAPVPPQDSLTDGAGIAVFSGLPTTRASLELRLQGEGIAPAIEYVSLPGAQPLERAHIFVRAQASVQVTCRQPSGAGVAARVYVVGLERQGWATRLLPPASDIGVGGGLISGIPAGLSIGLAAVVDGGPAGIVVLDPLQPGELRHVELEILPLSELRLRMVDGAGGPVSGSFRLRAVEAQPPVDYPTGWHPGDRAGRWSAQAACNREGLASVLVPSGEYRVRALGPDSALVEEVFLSAPTDEERVFVVKAYGDRLGILVDGEGAPLANWGVEASGHRGAPTRVVTQSDGQFLVPTSSSDIFQVNVIHPCGLRVPVFDGPVETWPEDGRMVVELHNVSVRVLDLRTGTAVAHRLRARNRREPVAIDESLGPFEPESDAGGTSRLRLPFGEWRVLPRILRPSNPKDDPGYTVWPRRHTVDGDLQLTLIATDYAQVTFADSWPSTSESVRLRWVASAGGRELEGVLSYPAHPFASNPVPLGELQLEVLEGPELWLGTRVVVHARGEALPF
jgi:hypothetical protein